MAAGKLNFMLSFLLLFCLLGLTNTAPTSNSTSDSVDKKKVFITGDRIEIIISSNERTNVPLKGILQKLESVTAENKKLVKSIQTLEGRILTLENKVGNAFMFPRKGITDYVIISGSMPSLSALTACFWMKATGTDGNSGTPLSYAVSSQDNEFIIYDYNSFKLFVGGEYRSVKTKLL
ncbi:Domain abundant in complement control protein, SUSHI repeat, short complement-like repeat (SCR) [Desmophyllum pertusum]|uniref:Domain abundant in complement control protein, SUSHI repeat, short complement-like repeat (SCR) n=1 Tax=Desmophyllum pertusum TaxID=174260 RepID=A0A9X0A3R6_9CNID|nr:Domain abundant in complement control protein, SUSHI repeat, short complement-like repeat (SCR) [Desmophyllum pertusum]